MLKFFRNIRQNLLSEGKTGKYLKYAVGEIVLVVIGILIALQINNWNERQKLDHSINKLLHKLIADLESDVARFDHIDSMYQKDLKEIEFVTEQALSFKNFKLDSVEQMIPGRGSVLFLQISKSTFNEMINTGMLYQISDEQLKNDIITYYEFVDLLLKKENNDNQNLNDWILGIKVADPKHIVMRMHAQRNLDQIDWSWLQNPQSAIYEDLETQIIWTKGAIFSNQKVMNQIKSEANNLKRKITNHKK